MILTLILILVLRKKIGKIEEENKRNRRKNRKTKKTRQKNEEERNKNSKTNMNFEEEKYEEPLPVVCAFLPYYTNVPSQIKRYDIIALIEK